MSQAFGSFPILLWVSFLSVACQPDFSDPFNKDHGPTWIEIIPDRIAGGDDTGLDLFRVVGAVSNRDASIAIANSGNGTLVVVEANGMVRTSYGRPGEGPQEFTNLVSLEKYRADSIFAFDRALRRTTVLDARTMKGRELAFEPPDGSLARPNVVGAFSDGSFLTRWSRRSPGVFESKPMRDSSVFALHDANGRIVKEIGLFMDTETFVAATPPSAGRPGRLVFMLRPFGRKTLVAVSDSTFVVAESADATLRLYRQTGDLVRSIVVPWTPRPIGLQEIQAYRATELQGVSAGSREGVQRRLDAVAFPDSLPPWRSVLVDSKGDIWAERHPAPLDTTSTWVVLSYSGNVVDQVLLPAALKIFEIGPGFLLASRRDPRTHLETVVRFRFGPSAR